MPLLCPILCVKGGRDAVRLQEVGYDNQFVIRRCLVRIDRGDPLRASGESDDKLATSCIRNFPDEDAHGLAHPELIHHAYGLRLDQNPD